MHQGGPPQGELQGSTQGQWGTAGLRGLRRAWSLEPWVGACVGSCLGSCLEGRLGWRLEHMGLGQGGRLGWNLEHMGLGQGGRLGRLGLEVLDEITQFA